MINRRQMARSPNNMRVYNDIRPIVVGQTNRDSGVITYIIITIARRYCNVVVQLIRHNDKPETAAYNTLSGLSENRDIDIGMDSTAAVEHFTADERVQAIRA